jgi:hypothetical protein
MGKKASLLLKNAMILEQLLKNYGFIGDKQRRCSLVGSQDPGVEGLSFVRVVSWWTSGPFSFYLVSWWQLC